MNHYYISIIYHYCHPVETDRIVTQRKEATYLETCGLPAIAGFPSESLSPRPWIHGWGVGAFQIRGFTIVKHNTAITRC